MDEEVALVRRSPQGIDDCALGYLDWYCFGDYLSDKRADIEELLYFFEGVGDLRSMFS